MTESRRPGLRERKKAKTRTAIRDCAFRLFREHGYEGTTVEQIADAAEVSPSTFFRYFGTKEDLVLSDDYDPLLVAAFEAQPSSMRPTQALRAAIGEVFGAMDDAERVGMRERLALMDTVPALRAAFMDQLAQSARALEEMAARRSGLEPEDIAVRTFAGATLGVLIATYLRWAAHPEADFITEIDAMLAVLERGLPL
jgi:AcrR family transcriptional regulator